MGSAWTTAGSNRSQSVSWLVLWLLAIVVARPALADDKTEDYKLAVGFYNKEQWKLAAARFQAFLKDQPQHPKTENARFYYGLTLIKLEEFNPAREALRQFVKDYPQSRDAISAGYWIGHASYFLDDFAQAEAELGRFVTAAPKEPLNEYALPYLADAELRLKKPEAAVKHFQQALDEFPKGEMADDARFGLARCYERLKKTPEAIRAYQEIAAHRTGPHAAEAQLNVGGLYFDGADYAAAAAAFAAFEKDFPESLQVPQAQLNLGFSLYQLHEYQKAIEQFDKAAKIEKYAAEGALWKGLCLKSLAEFPQAIAVLKAAFEKHRDLPIAERLLFQWAVCEERRGERATARRLFIEVADRWPTGSLADESLHAASLAAVDAGELPEAENLFARFDRDFPGNRLRYRQEILKGRVLAARNDFSGAAKHFQTVIAASEIDSTRLQARFYLGHARQQLGEHTQALEVTEPLANAIISEKVLTDYAGVFVLRGLSQLELAKAAVANAKPGEESQEAAALCAAAVASAKNYAAAVPAGPLAARALAVIAIAEALASRKDAALNSLVTLRKSHPQSPELGEALDELGEIAYSKKDFEFAERLYGELAGWPKESRRHAKALTDLGWSQYKQKKNSEAAASFSRLLAEHPDDKLVPEAAFMRGQSLEDGGKTSEAQAAYAAAWKRPGNGEYTFDAGLQAARLSARLKKTAEADAIYRELLERFPKRPDGDRVLNEWAVVHYDAQKFQQADEVFRRLANEYPNSDLADNARLSLAESDLVAGNLEQARTQFVALSTSAAADETVQQRALYQMIRIELEAKRWEELRKACDTSLERFPEGTYHYEAELRRAEADFNLSDFKAAEERLLKLKALQDDPLVKKAEWFPPVWVMLAETQWRQKRYDAVATTVAEYRSWDPESPLIYQADEVLGRSFKSQARFPEAREAFERVIQNAHGKLSETAAKSQFLLADTFLQEKDYQKALEEYLKVDILYKFPDLQAAALYQAGVCCEELELWKLAAKNYDEMLLRFPKSEHAAKARERLLEVRKRIGPG